MSNYTTSAINLKSYTFNEADKIIVMYSREKGLMRAVAKCSGKKASNLCARIDLLVANKLLLHQGKNLSTICQAELINPFKNIRKDIKKITYATYCSDIVNNFSMEHDPNSEEIFELFYSTLKRISDSKDLYQTLIAVIKFQLKFMQASGYSINVNSCTCCGMELQGPAQALSASVGGALCTNCKKNVMDVKLVHMKLLGLLRTFLDEDYETRTKYDDLQNELILNFCFNFLKDYIKILSPKKLKSEDLIECLC